MTREKFCDFKSSTYNWKTSVILKLPFSLYVRRQLKAAVLFKVTKTLENKAVETHLKHCRSSIVLLHAGVLTFGRLKTITYLCDVINNNRNGDDGSVPACRWLAAWKASSTGWTPSAWSRRSSRRRSSAFYRCARSFVTSSPRRAARGFAVRSRDGVRSAISESRAPPTRWRSWGDSDPPLVVKNGDFVEITIL